MRAFLSSTVAVLAVIAFQKESCEAFTTPITAPSTTKANIMNLNMIERNTESNDVNNRRAFLSKFASISASLTAASFLPNPITTPAALAFGGALSKVNAKLSAYGLPLMKEVPGGFSPLVELYGKGRNRKPLLVEFLFPSDWVVVLPNNDVNSEEGTIQAGQYSAGDTATFFVWNDAEKVEDITTQPKEFYQNAVIKSISQKGDNIYQNFKITKMEPIEGEYKNQKYVLVDFRYELLTGAGFEVDRRGVASITNQGESVQVLWAASTRQRYKKTEEALRTIAKSFRVYSDGLGLAIAEAEKEGF